ncbi:uncharacterized protein LOC115609526 [Strigops habroptila]|uniref:uncharacterized protein LOC115609526 n=1 Tax=Strigops habroptila TaxID=2489341 RepID=UPI0011CFB180|nr:uncharacterized protein LOC115609526 [Strigops habroptila]
MRLSFVSNVSPPSRRGARPGAIAMRGFTAGSTFLSELTSRTRVHNMEGSPAVRRGGQENMMELWGGEEERRCPTSLKPAMGSGTWMQEAPVKGTTFRVHTWEEVTAGRRAPWASLLTRFHSKDCGLEKHQHSPHRGELCGHCPPQGTITPPKGITGGCWGLNEGHRGPSPSLLVWILSTTCCVFKSAGETLDSPVKLPRAQGRYLLAKYPDHRQL